MDIDTAVQAEVNKADGIVKKSPRKPRPSELAAKEVKALKGRKARVKKAKKAKKPKVKKPAVKKTKAKAVKTKRKPGKPKVKAGVIARPERVDMRVTKTEKARLVAKAKRLRRTVTSIVMEAVEKITK